MGRQEDCICRSISLGYLDGFSTEFDDRTAVTAVVDV